MRKKLSNDWKYQRFQNGDIWSHGTKESRIVLYNLRDSFYKNGGYSSLGGPVADEENMGRGWWRQRFQYGDVWSKDGTDYRFVIKFDLRDSWNRHRGFSWLARLWRTRRTWVTVIGVSVARTVMCGPVTGLPRSTS